MKIRKLFGKEKVLDALKRLTAIRFRISHSSLLQASILLLVLFLAFIVRLLPIRWGLYLSEFDPYYQYRVTKHAVEYGLHNWATGWSEIDPSRDLMSWYPYGRYIASTYPGLPLTAAASYLIVHTLGLPLNVFEFCVIFPAIMGTLTCLVIYFLGKDIGGKQVGLLSALFLALSSAHISRTSLGFFDDETVGICGILLFIFFFLRSIESERTLKNSLAYAVAAGLSMGWIFSSWGASRYALDMAALFIFILLLLRRYSSRLLFSYSTAFGIALFIAVNVPKLGFNFLTRTSVLPVAAVFVLLAIFEIASHVKTLRNKALFVFLFLGLGAGVFFMLSSYGYLMPMGTKFLYVLNPLQRVESALHQSVQEHRPAAWGSFYYDFGIGMFFIPVGLFFAVRNPTSRNIFLAIFGLTSIYFAGSMVRLTLILAPAISLLWALALVRLIKPFVTVMGKAPAIPRRRTGLEAHVGKEFSAAFLIAMFLLLTLTFVLPTQRVLNHAYSPTTIAAASMPLKPAGTVPDFIETFDWMQGNLTLWEQEHNKRAVVASWWDYGYWITNLGNKTSLADNGTWNLTQIQQIGRMFMSEETEAIEILKKYEATHVLVFTTFDTQGRETRFGDEGKWRWMARIPDLDDNSFGNYTLGVDWRDENDDGGVDEGELQPNSKGQSTVLYKLMTYGKEMTLQGSSNIQAEHFEEAYFSQRKRGAPEPAPGTQYVPLVCVYEINYES
jgi:dolichyl-diphosphooligosaccharide--protein glycosyltransferase